MLEAARRPLEAMCLLTAANEIGSWARKEGIERALLVPCSCFPWLKYARDHQLDDEVEETLCRGHAVLP